MLFTTSHQVQTPVNNEWYEASEAGHFRFFCRSLKKQFSALLRGHGIKLKKKIKIRSPVQFIVTNDS